MPADDAATSTTRRSSNVKDLTWTTARCHRLIRPLTSKLQALRALTETLPSTTEVLVTVKDPKVDLGDLPYEPSATALVSNAQASLFRDYRRSKPVSRTYSSKGSAGQNARASSSASAFASTTTSVFDQAFPAAAINWDAPLPQQDAVEVQVPRIKKPAPPQKIMKDTPDTKELLQSLKQFVHKSVFEKYQGIYNAMEQLLLATTQELKQGPPSLREIAARRVSHCIIATSDEVSDDVWYDAVGEVGKKGENLREVVRWHGVEMIREAVRSDFMPAQKNGVGLATVLVGLCRELGAEMEAESLLQSMFDMQPLTTCSSDPPLTTLTMFWGNSRSTTFRILTRNLVSEGTPLALGNPTLNTRLKDAIVSLDHDVAAEFVSKALEFGFGIWGENYILAAAERRKQHHRRKGSRHAPSSSNIGLHRKPRKLPPLPDRVGNRAENMVLEIIEQLVRKSFENDLGKANHIIRSLAEGFVLQDQQSRDETEEAWEEQFPIAGKIMVLLRFMIDGHSGHDHLLTEVVRSVEDVYASADKNGIKSVGQYIAECFHPIAVHRNGIRTFLEPTADIRSTVDLLISAAKSRKISTHHSSSKVGPVTPAPKLHSNTLVTFTPGLSSPSDIADIQQRKSRFYLAQLALSMAIGFSLLAFARTNEDWISWASTVEHRVIGLKTRTPARQVPHPVTTPARAAAMQRKGWRYEEGIGEWVAVGGTPAAAIVKRREQRARRSRFTAVAINIDTAKSPGWKNAYKNYVEGAPLSGDDPDTSYSKLFSEEEQSSASDMSSDNDGDDDGEYYAPTPAKPPASIRRSPRSAARLCKSLKRPYAAVVRSSPTRRLPSSSSPIRNESLPRFVDFQDTLPYADDDDDDDDEFETSIISTVSGRRKSVRFLPSDEDDESEDELSYSRPKRTRGKPLFDGSSEEGPLVHSLQSSPSSPRKAPQATARSLRPRLQPLAPSPSRKEPQVVIRSLPCSPQNEPAVVIHYSPQNRKRKLAELSQSEYNIRREGEEDREDSGEEDELAAPVKTGVVVVLPTSKRRKLLSTRTRQEEEY